MFILNKECLKLDYVIIENIYTYKDIEENILLKTLTWLFVFQIKLIIIKHNNLVIILNEKILLIKTKL